MQLVAAVYRGKWSKASKEEVDAAIASGAPYCYRFRVRDREFKAIVVVQGVLLCLIVG